MPQRILFGLDRVPRALSPDDPRLPGAMVDAAPLRLNTEPLPPDAMPAASGHAARMAAMQQFLLGLCGDYAPRRVRFMTAYLEAVAAHLAAYRDELADGLRRYHRLYAPEDWFWSALRPLPRAWLRTETGTAGVEVAFWDGWQVIAIDLGGMPDAVAGVTCRITPELLGDDPLRLFDHLPGAFREFWRGETLPRSPFRRAIPPGVLTEVD